MMTLPFPSWAKYAAAAAGVLVVLYVASVGVRHSIETYREHRFAAQEAKRMKQIADLEQERAHLQQANAELSGEVAELKTERAAEERIIASRGGDVAAQEKKIAAAKEEYQRETQETDQPLEPVARCRRLRDKFVALHIKGADQIDCDRLIGQSSP